MVGDINRHAVRSILGLAFFSRIVREHVGRIRLDSPKGQGTTFYVWLRVKSDFV